MISAGTHWGKGRPRWKLGLSLGSCNEANCSGATTRRRPRRPVGTQDKQLGICHVGHARAITSGVMPNNSEATLRRGRKTIANSPDSSRSTGVLALSGLLVIILSFAVAMLLALSASAYAASSDAVLVAPQSSAGQSAGTELGSVESFWVKDKSKPGDTFFRLNATARYVGQQCVVYLNASESLPQVLIDSLGSAFDATIQPKLTSVLGEGPPAGSLGPDKVAILLYDFGDGSVEGLFRPADLSGTGGEDHSNQRQIIYINTGAIEGETDTLCALAAHEFAHLIVYYRDYLLHQSPGQTPEADWLNEGIAVYAEHLAGYDVRAARQLSSFALDTNLNMAQNPWPGFMPYYGASYAFLSYLVAQEGEGFLGKLVDEPLDGVAGIDAVLRSVDPWETFDSLFAGWVAADYLDAKPPETQSWSIPDMVIRPEAAEVVGKTPWIGPESVVNYGARYVDFPQSSRGSPFQVVVDGDDTAPLHAALISWDSEGGLAPSVVEVQLATATKGGSVESPLGYDCHTLAVWALGQEGREASYGFRYSASVNKPAGSQFLDLSGDDPYYPSIASFVSRGVVSGKEIPQGSGLWFFEGEGTLLRAQVAKMIVTSLGLGVDETMKAPFTDMGPDDPLNLYPHNYVAVAYAAGIVRGKTANVFSPYMSVTRAQAISMIVRAFGSLRPGLLMPPPIGYRGSLGNFSLDHAENARIAEYNGLLGGLIGFGPGWSPWQACSRSEASYMLARLLELRDR